MTNHARQTSPAGWARPPGNREWHYFEAGSWYSACGRQHFGVRRPEKGEGEACAACERHVASMSAPPGA